MELGHQLQDFLLKQDEVHLKGGTLCPLHVLGAAKARCQFHLAHIWAQSFSGRPIVHDVKGPRIHASREFHKLVWRNDAFGHHGIASPMWGVDFGNDVIIGGELY